MVKRNYEIRRRRILAADDETDLQEMLEGTANEKGNFSSKTPNGPSYVFEVIRLDVTKLMNGSWPHFTVNEEYLNEMGLWEGEDDILLLDLNFKGDYSGKIFMNALSEIRYKCGDEVETVDMEIIDADSSLYETPHQNAKVQTVPYRPKIVVSTSLEQEVDPDHVDPDIAFVENYDVFGHNKAKNQHTRTLDYGRYAINVFEKLVDVYDGKVEPLNR